MLHDDLAVLGARLMVEVLAQEKMSCVAQPAVGATYAKKIDKTEARIDFARPAVDVRNHIHGLSPFPGAWFMVNGTRVKVLASEAVAGAGVAGVFLDDQLTVACGSGAVRLLKLQREGKGAMDAGTFLRGFAIAKGTDTIVSNAPSPLREAVGVAQSADTSPPGAFRATLPVKGREG